MIYLFRKHKRRRWTGILKPNKKRPSGLGCEPAHSGLFCPKITYFINGPHIKCTMRSRAYNKSRTLKDTFLADSCEKCHFAFGLKKKLPKK
jgi:hypothetical protein